MLPLGNLLLCLTLKTEPKFSGKKHAIYCVIILSVMSLKSATCHV
jgi:hypothetical protein